MRNPLLNREACCADKMLLFMTSNRDPVEIGDGCTAFKAWSDSYAPSFAVYVGCALVFGIISSGATMLTKCSLPAAMPVTEDGNEHCGPTRPAASGKTMYMAAGSGIPEIKTILSGRSDERPSRTDEW